MGPRMERYFEALMDEAVTVATTGNINSVWRNCLDKGLCQHLVAGMLMALEVERCPAKHSALHHFLTAPHLCGGDTSVSIFHLALMTLNLDLATELSRADAVPGLFRLIRLAPPPSQPGLLTPILGPRMSEYLHKRLRKVEDTAALVRYVKAESYCDRLMLKEGGGYDTVLDELAVASALILYEVEEEGPRRHWLHEVLTAPFKGRPTMPWRRDDIESASLFDLALITQRYALAAALQELTGSGQLQVWHLGSPLPSNKWALVPDEDASVLQGVRQHRASEGQQFSETEMGYCPWSRCPAGATAAEDCEAPFSDAKAALSRDFAMYMLGEAAANRLAGWRPTSKAIRRLLDAALLLGVPAAAEALGLQCDSWPLRVYTESDLRHLFSEDFRDSKVCRQMPPRFCNWLEAHYRLGASFEPLAGLLVRVAVENSNVGLAHYLLYRCKLSPCTSAQLVLNVTEDGLRSHAEAPCSSLQIPVPLCPSKCLVDQGVFEPAFLEVLRVLRATNVHVTKAVCFPLLPHRPPFTTFHCRCIFPLSWNPALWDPMPIDSNLLSLAIRLGDPAACCELASWGHEWDLNADPNALITAETAYMSECSCPVPPHVFVPCGGLPDRIAAAAAAAEAGSGRARGILKLACRKGLWAQTRLALSEHVQNIIFSYMCPFQKLLDFLASFSQPEDSEEDSSSSSPQHFDDAAAAALTTGTEVPERPAAAAAALTPGTEEKAEGSEEEADLARALEESAVEQDLKEQEVLHRAILLSKPDRFNEDGMILVRLTKHKTAVPVLLQSAHLEECRNVVLDAVGELQPRWARRALLLVPMTKKIWRQEAKLRLRPHHVLLLEKDLDLLKTALREVRSCERPKVSRDHRAELEEDFCSGLEVVHTFLHFRPPRGSQEADSSSVLLQSAPAALEGESQSSQAPNPRRHLR